jgi:hypothetical protein
MENVNHALKDAISAKMVKLVLNVQTLSFLQIMQLHAQILVLMVLNQIKENVHHVLLKNVNLAMVPPTDVHIVLYPTFYMKINVFQCVPINYTTEHKMEGLVQNALLVVSHALMKDALLVLMDIP